MNRIVLALGLLLISTSSFAEEGAIAKSNFFTLTATANDGQIKPLSDYRGKVVLVVNVASRCGYTPQYEGLQKIYEKHRDKGFVVLGFPSNDFGKQEPGTDKEIKSFCELNYRVDFPLFQKNPVKGEAKQSVYKFLVENAPAEKKGEVEWNFEKFLVDRSGNVVGRWSSGTKPDDPVMVGMIDKLLNENPPKKPATKKAI